MQFFNDKKYLVEVVPKIIIKSKNKLWFYIIIYCWMSILNIKIFFPWRISDLYTSSRIPKTTSFQMSLFCPINLTMLLGLVGTKLGNNNHVFTNQIGLGVLVISCTYTDHITYIIAFYNKMKRWSRTITSRANVMPIHCELLTNVSIAKEDGVEIHDCHQP